MSSSELLRTLNTDLGVVGRQRTSTIRDKSLDSRPAVLSLFITCRLNGASTCNIVWIVILVIFADLCSFIKLSFPYFTHIPLNYKAINYSYRTSFRRLKRSMVARLGARPG